MTDAASTARRRRNVPGLPGLTTLLGYQRDWLRGDLVGGCTVAAYLIPQVMAYATIAGLPPVIGLWAILPPMTIYALSGSSRQLSVGPESTTALMTAAVVGPLAGGDPTRYAALAAGLAIIVGLLCTIFWMMRLGFVADLLSRPVLIGYMAGIAAIMVAGQLQRITGVPADGDGVLAEVATFLTNLDKVQPTTILAGAAILAFLFVIQWRWRTAPGALLAVILATAVVFMLDLEEHGIGVVGETPTGFPHPSLPPLADFAPLIIPALGVVLVGYTDNVLTARAFAQNGQSDIDPNQELLALGASNVGAGLVGGFPISSSASRTALAAAARSNTQLYSLVAVGWTLGALLLLGPLLAHFPTVALGAIVVYAAIKLIDLPGFVRLGRFRRSELLLAVVALVGVLAAGILYGVLIAVALSVVDMLRRVVRPHSAVEGLVPGLAGMHDIEDFETAREVPGLLVYRYDSPMFFANADDFRRRALAAVTLETQPVKWFVLNMEANVTVDITALDAVEALRSKLSEQGIVFALARVKQGLLADLEAFGLIGRIGTEHVFPTLPTAIAAYNEWSATGYIRQMRLTSPAFAGGETIPDKHTVDGRGTSPPLEFDGVPAEAVSLVLIMDDPDVPRDRRPDGMFDHWIIWNIPPDCAGATEGQAPPGVLGGTTAGTTRYVPPAPPYGRHRYFFRLYALDALLELPPGSSKATVLRAIDGHVLAQSELIGVFR